MAIYRKVLPFETLGNQEADIDTLTAAGEENPSSLRSRGGPALVPHSESVSAKLFEEPAFQKMTLDVESVVDGGVDRQESLR